MQRSLIISPFQVTSPLHYAVTLSSSTRSSSCRFVHARTGGIRHLALHHPFICSFAPRRTCHPAAAIIRRCQPQVCRYHLSIARPVQPALEVLTCSSAQTTDGSILHIHSIHSSSLKPSSLTRYLVDLVDLFVGFVSAQVAWKKKSFGKRGLVWFAFLPCGCRVSFFLFFFSFFVEDGFDLVVGWLVGWVVGWLAGCLVVWLVGW